MGKIKVLLDTNVVIDIYRSKRKSVSKLSNLPPHVKYISIVTYAEFLGGVKHEYKPQARKFLSEFKLLEFTAGCSTALKRLAIKYQFAPNKRKSPTPDFMIAASAIANKMTLATSNMKDFGFNELNIHEYK